MYAYHQPDQSVATWGGITVTLASYIAVLLTDAQIPFTQNPKSVKLFVIITAVEQNSVAMGLLTILKKMKQKEREMRLLMLYPVCSSLLA